MDKKVKKYIEKSKTQKRIEINNNCTKNTIPLIIISINTYIGNVCLLTAGYLLYKLRTILKLLFNNN